MAIREAPPTDRAELRSKLRQQTEALYERIRRGDADVGPWRAAVMAHVRYTVEDKLRVVAPGDGMGSYRFRTRKA